MQHDQHHRDYVKHWTAMAECAETGRAHFEKMAKNYSGHPIAGFARANGLQCERDWATAMRKLGKTN